MLLSYRLTERNVLPRGAVRYALLTVQYWLVRGIPNNLGSFPLIEPVLFGITPVQMGLIEIPIIGGLNFELCKRCHCFSYPLPDPVFDASTCMLKIGTG